MEMGVWADLEPADTHLYESHLRHERGEQERLVPQREGAEAQARAAAFGVGPHGAHFHHAVQLAGAGRESAVVQSHSAQQMEVQNAVMLTYPPPTAVNAIAPRSTDSTAARCEGDGAL